MLKLSNYMRSDFWYGGAWTILVENSKQDIKENARVKQQQMSTEI